MGPSSFRWPDCPAYWSLDPLGVTRLSMEDATHLGFPSIYISTMAWGSYWDASAYAGLRQFYQAKGFDPDSQNIARHLGYPIYQLSPGVGVPLAHASCVDSHAEEKDQRSLIVDGDWEETQGLAGEDHDDEDCPEEGHRGPVNPDDGAEDAHASAYENDVHESTSRVGSEEPEPPSPHDPEMPVISWTFKFTMNLHLTLIFSLVFCWLYERVL
ncbi:hypothetical protein B0H13DRAFT_471184 [Mycena leptocephala]|nr:hypothetical protein B0H13DRAFT_471184 [Mycena leptocephala]